MDYEAQYDKIYRYCYRRLHHRQLAEDVTQEAFLRLLAAEGYRETGKAIRYLYTVARNLCIDEYRRHPTQELPVDLPSPDQEDDRVEIIDGVFKELHGMIIKMNRRRKKMCVSLDTQGIPMQIWLSYELVEKEEA